MPKKSFDDFTNIFFWDFKRMDNVNYNFSIVEILYKDRKINGDNRLYNKPITVILVSIIECILYDFVQRVTQHSREAIPNMEEAIIDDTRAKELDMLEPLIAHTKKCNLLRAGQDDNIYDDLDLLRKVRNRVHIQNTSKQLDKNEYGVYTDENRKLAEGCLIRVCEVLCHVYPRPNREFLSMSYFPEPWS